MVAANAALTLSLCFCCSLCRLFGEASAEGDRDAQAHLASMWLAGVGAPQKDVSKAVEFYTAAAQQGHVRAQATLAVSEKLEQPHGPWLRFCSLC